MYLIVNLQSDESTKYRLGWGDEFLWRTLDLLAHKFELQ